MLCQVSLKKDFIQLNEVWVLAVAQRYFIGGHVNCPSYKSTCHLWDIVSINLTPSVPKNIEQLFEMPNFSLNGFHFT